VGRCRMDSMQGVCQPEPKSPVRVTLAASIGFAPITLRDLRAPCTQRTCQQRLPLTLSLFTHTPTSDVGKWQDVQGCFRCCALESSDHD
jgi:hypothetical protein